MATYYEKVIRSGSRHQNRIAITFDDGPDSQFTPRVLDILRDNHVRATFFVTGEMSKQHPVVLERIVREGHILGNHSWDHPKFTDIPLDQVNNQVDSTNLVVSELVGKRMRLFRPPYGAVNEEVVASLDSRGFFIVNWDVDTNDWRKAWTHSAPRPEWVNSDHTAKMIVQDVKEQLRGGSIILMHSAPWILEDRLHALRDILSYVKNELAYEFVTVDQLLNIPAYYIEPSMPAAIRYKVKPGDTLWKIAIRHKTTVEAIRRMNQLADIDTIYIGQNLLIPLG